MEYNNKCILSLMAWLVGVGPSLHAQDAVSTTLDQLAALEGYIHTAEKGYHIAAHGLYLIRDVKDGEYDLHQVFFGSLRLADSAVLHDPMLAVAYNEAVATKRLLELAEKVYLSSKWLQPDEHNYILSVCEKLDDEVRDDLLALQLMAKSGSLSVMDGDRLEYIQTVSAHVHARYVYVRLWLAEVEWLIAARTKEELFIGSLKQWYGLQ